MDIKELRIGNIIERNGVIAKIEVINNEIDEVYFIGEDFYYSDFCCNINPIQLTEEWLFKFGFKEVKNEPRRWFKIQTKKRGVTLEICFQQKRICISDKYNFTDLKFIKYVHQLQNLYFALTQTELTLS